MFRASDVILLNELTVEKWTEIHTTPGYEVENLLESREQRGMIALGSRVELVAVERI
jgi:hypothetical protein